MLKLFNTGIVTSSVLTLHKKHVLDLHIANKPLTLVDNINYY